MPDIILRILSIIGILLLVLLGIFLVAVLLLLFWPVTYRVKGEKTPESLGITARVDWLFGLFRVRCTYPEPGRLIVKLLWKTLMDTELKKGKTGEGASPDGKDTEAGKQAGQPEKNEEGGANREQPENKETGADKEQPENKETGSGKEQPETGADSGEAEGTGKALEADEQAGEGTGTGNEAEAGGPFSPIFQKFQKIKYTILKIYDKIKEIWANITYYNDLLHEENTVLLWKHVKLRLGKILKSIRPRRIRANVLFGTGAPDTTGYVYGVYGMLLPILGGQVCLTPDFNQAVLEGDFDVAGHVTLYTLAWNALKLLLDKKLRLFIKKMKAGRKGNGR